jgi:hypothetical protein
MHHRKLLGLVLSVAALAVTSAPAAAAQKPPAPAQPSFFKSATGLKSEPEGFAGFMDYTDDV